jgi:23S rRNA (guanosine2251-2'-O)-methyltransferase
VPAISPRDQFITVYGRMPVLEALRDSRLAVDKVLLARTARGESVDEIVAAARQRGLRVERVAPERVTRISRNGRHDQGVVADVAAPGLGELTDWLAGRPGASPARLLLLDGVTNPANVGMIVRTAVAAGLDGVVLPRVGVPDVGPLVVKASAGVAFRATLLRCPSAAEGARLARDAGLEVVGLAGDAPASLFDADLPERALYVLGNETEGVSPAVASTVGSWVAIPLAGGVESLNVASAAAVLCFEATRRPRP